MATDPGGFTRVPPDLRFKVGLLLGVTLILAAGFVLYVLYARGVFEATQRLTLVAENAEGVAIGMPLTFSGFPVGRVQRIALAEDGRARIVIEVPLNDARWLRASSVFTLERGLVGAARLRAFTGDLQDAPLPDGAVRPVLRGDATEEIPRMVATLRSALENIEHMTGADGSLRASLADLQQLIERFGERLGGPHGLLGAMLGSDEDAKKALGAIDRANALLASLSGVSRKLERVLDRTDQRVFGKGGIMEGTERAVLQVNALLGEARERLGEVDKILADVQAVSGNAKAASTDLGALRAEVDASVRRIAALIDEINRKWPFKRDPEIRLP
jgi:phospholipid/cholesterol/gamma-HCH transport system substrate-binding protein